MSLGDQVTDWRLQGQDRYLRGKVFHHQSYIPDRAGWDHDHCEFCGRKFALIGGDFVEGYTTEDTYHWVCTDCFRELKDVVGMKEDS